MSCTFRTCRWALYSTLHLARLASWLKRSFLWVLLAIGSSWALASPPPTLTDAKRLERVRASLVDIEVELSRVVGQVTGASGFVAGQPDWVITNLHALDRVIFHSDDHRLRVRGAQGQRLSAHVLAIDVVNDLVLLHTDLPLAGTPLAVAADLPAEGAPLWAMGNAGGDGFVVHRGTHAGLEADAISPSMEFDGDIKPGMSGGPVLDVAGRVVAVNRARSTENQGLGYLVPGQAVLRLMEQARTSPYRLAESMVQDMQRQYRAFSQAHVDRWTARALPPQRMGPFQVPVGFTEDACTANRYERPTERFVVYRLNCQSMEFAPFLDDLDIAVIQMRHYWVTNPWHGDLKSARAASFLMRYLREEDAGEVREHNHWTCRYNRVKNAAGQNLDLQACRRPYLRLGGFHDYRLRAALEVQGPDALVTALDMAGIDEANASRLTRHWLDQIRRPVEPGRKWGQP